MNSEITVGKATASLSPAHRLTRERHPLAGRIQTDIITWLCDQVRGKELLDVGCVDHDVDKPGMKDRWLHGHLVRSAKSTLGLDMLERDCAKMRDRGFNVVAGDACLIDLGRQFEVIVAGEIIEHVENPGALLRNLARHLTPGGKLIVTTPNPHFALHFYESIFRDPRKEWNAEHVGWFDPFVMENLVVRCDLRVEQIYYFTRSRKLLRLIKQGLPCWGWLSSSIAAVITR